MWPGGAQLWESWDVAIELMLCQLVNKLGIPEPPPADASPQPGSGAASGTTAGPAGTVPGGASAKPKAVPVLGESLRADTEGRGIVQGLPTIPEPMRVSGWKGNNAVAVLCGARYCDTPHGTQPSCS